MHGMADDNVLFTHSIALMQAMQDAGIQFQLMTYPGSKHALQEPNIAMHRYRCILDFFERTWRDQPGRQGIAGTHSRSSRGLPPPRRRRLSGCGLLHGRRERTLLRRAPGTAGYCHRSQRIVSSTGSRVTAPNRPMG